MKTAAEVESLLRLPSLGVLPSFHLNGSGKSDERKLAPLRAEGNGAKSVAIQKNQDALEAFRSLRTSILLWANPVPEMLLITSALPGEGKDDDHGQFGSDPCEPGQQGGDRGL